MDEVEVGTLYEIDHTKLPPDSPVQLNPIRVAMVIEKNDQKVSLRFPGMSSLRTHFGHGGSSTSSSSNIYYSTTRTSSKMMIPSLDEKYVMASSFAGEVLYRKIPSEEWSEHRHSWSFWVVPSMAPMEASTANTMRNTTNTMDVVVSNKGSCLLSELKATEMVKWGKRQRVKFIGRHSSSGVGGGGEKSSKFHFQPSSNTDAIDREDEKLIEPDLKQIEEVEEEEEEEESGKEEEEENEKEEEEEETENCGSPQRRRNRKRKCKTHIRFQTSRRSENQRTGHIHKKQKVLKNAINRWSEERFKLAEESMLKVMKAKGAVAGNPILRLELRQEARRWIGDTGLLDHLLKHMAGKVAPGGVERFRRRHNPEGAMEYWLEKADLFRIRREAGVQDPYWIPPPGWKPGDNPRQDPILARDIREIKEKMAQMERDMVELKSKKIDENQAIVTTPRSCIINQNMEDDSSSWLAAKEMFLEVVKRNDELEEQVLTLSHSLKDMEREMVKLKSSPVKQLSAVDQKLVSQAATEIATFAAIAIPPACTEKENKKGNDQFKLEEDQLQLVVLQSAGKDKEKAISDEDELAKGQHVKATSSSTATQKAAAAAAKAAEKAAMVQRLKSGFRICRPQGTFRWPADMSAVPSPIMSHSLVQDPLLVPTPPSALSSTTIPLPPPASSPSLPRPPSPLKPLPQRRPIKVKIPIINTSSTTISGTGGIFSSTPTSHGQYVSKKNANLLDLNNAPFDNLNDAGICGTTPTSTP